MLNKIQRIFSLSEIKLITVIMIFIFITVQSVFDIIGLGLLIALISYIWIGIESNVILFIKAALSNYALASSELTLLFIVSLFFLLRYIAFTTTTYLITDVASRSLTLLRQKMLRSINCLSFDKINEMELAEIQRTVFELTNGFIGQAFTNSFKLIADLFLIFLVASLISYLIDPRFIVAMISLLLMILVVDFMLKKYQSSAGKVSAEGSRNILNVLRDFHVSLRFAKISNHSEFFIGRLVKPNVLYSKSWRNSVFLSNLSRYTLEILIISSCILFIYFAPVNSELEIERNFLVLVLFVRLLPLGTSVSTSLAQLRNSEFLINELTKYNLAEISGNKDNLITSDKLIDTIEVSNLSFSIGENTLFENLSFQAKRGQILGIVGRTGSGKSSLVDIIAGLKKPYCGDVVFRSIDGLEIMQPAISFVDQYPFMFAGTLAENIHLKQSSKLSDAAEQLLYKFNLLESENVVKKTDYTADTLSGGERQRINIIRGLVSRANVYFMDEPTSALDQNTTHEVMRELRKICNNGAIVFIITHNENMMDQFDAIIKLG